MMKNININNMNMKKIMSRKKKDFKWSSNKRGKERHVMDHPDLIPLLNVPSRTTEQQQEQQEHNNKNNSIQ